MGKKSKGHNQKARQVCEDTNIKRNKALQKLVDTDKEVYVNTAENDSNLMVVDSKKSKAKKNLSEVHGTKKSILSKKQKKRLQKIVDIKKKKEKRAEVLKSLAAHQISQEELAKYKSSSQIGNKQEPNKRKITDPFETEISTSKRKRKNKSNKKKKELKVGQTEALLKEEDSDDERITSSEDEAIQSKIDEKSVDSNDREGQDVEESVDTKEENEVEKEEDTDRDELSEEKSSETKAEKEQDADPPVSSSSSNEKIVNTANKDDNKCEEMKKESKPSVFVQVERDPKIQTARLLLPIIGEEQVIMETIQENDVTLICGSTGSGKTTQVPQFLYEAGYGTHSSRAGMIGVTEPRRVAAVSMSKRVATEMNTSTRKVSYQIRYEGNSTDETVIRFMTDGVLLKEMEKDFLLTKYSVVVIDEAHERSVYTDILIGLLSRVVPLRRKQNNPLKLIIMSATLRIEDFSENKRLFPSPPPVINVEGRQYPVTIHFNKRTSDDYVTDAYKKVCKIHRTLKVDGGILVFMTGQNEVMSLCRKLAKTFPKRKRKEQQVTRETNEKGLPKVNLDKYSSKPDEIDVLEMEEELPLSDNENDMVADDASDGDGIDQSDDEINTDSFASPADEVSPLHVLPLYSLLSSARQAQVFNDPPEGCRLCVIATNVAETSLTIPGIKYVIDSGRVKRKIYDKVTGVSTFRVTWTSKASANQRAGRAGRVGPGHCYRLYSSAVFQNGFEEYAEPEICGRPVEDLMLQMKNLCIDKVINFPFPNPPEPKSLKAAEAILLKLGALKKQKVKNGQELAVISKLGRQMSKIPLLPRFSKMVLLACQQNAQCVQYIVAIVAALTVKELFTDDIDVSNLVDAEDNEINIKRKRILLTQARRKWCGEGSGSKLGDLMVILRAVGACEFSGCSPEFCSKNGLRYKSMVEIRKLRGQLTNAVSSVCGNGSLFVNPKMEPPNENQAEVIRKIVLSSLGDHVARKIPPEEAKAKKLRNAYMCCLSEDPVYIHPTSSLFTKLPEYIVFHEIIETSKSYMRRCYAVEEEWLPSYAPYMCQLGKPSEEPPPCLREGKVYCHRSCTFGPHVWTLPPCFVDSSDWSLRFRWFARFLLEGEVVTRLKDNITNLLTPPAVMVKSWSHLQPKTDRLLSALLEKDVDSRDKLIRIWKKEPMYLLEEYLDWIPHAYHVEIKHHWPPISTI